jgi:hypothetical protein
LFTSSFAETPAIIKTEGEQDTYENTEMMFLDDTSSCEEIDKFNDTKKKRRLPRRTCSSVFTEKL